MRILVVENDTLSRELSRRVLTAGGYDVTCAQDGEEALRLSARAVPDLVLMDLGLPGIDGIETMRRIHAAPATAEVPVAMLSAQAFGDSVKAARDAGCAAYLTKPIGARELLDRVGELLGVAPGPRGSLSKRTARRRRS